MREKIRDELRRYGTEPYEREPERVRIAILNVAGADAQALVEWVDIAKRDYRDVLAAAEYPTALVSPTWQLSDEERAAIARSDAAQYANWLDE